MRGLPEMRVLGFVVGSAVASVPAAGQGDFNSWLDAQWQATKEQVSYPNHRIAWKVEKHEVPPPGELERLRAQVAKVPEHPDRELLSAYDRRRAGQPDVEEHTFWDGGPGRLRYNRTFGADSSVGYFDIVVTARDYWGMTEEQLTLLKPGQQVAGRDYTTSEPGVRNHLSLMTTGGFGFVPSMSLDEASRTLSDGAWTCRGMITQTGASVQFEGRWHTELGTFVVDRLTIRPATAALDDPAQHWLMSAWRFDPVLERPVAGRVAEYLPDGRLRRVFLLGTIAPLGDGEFARVTKTPDPTTTSDATRGSVTFRSVWDYLNQGAFLVKNAETGALETALRTTDPTIPEGKLRRIGWVVAALVIASLVWIRIRRSRAVD